MYICLKVSIFLDCQGHHGGLVLLRYLRHRQGREEVLGLYLGSQPWGDSGHRPIHPGDLSGDHQGRGCLPQSHTALAYKETTSFFNKTKNLQWREAGVMGWREHHRSGLCYMEQDFLTHTPGHYIQAVWDSYCSMYKLLHSC